MYVKLYALIDAIQKFRHYLLSHKFIVRTNSKPAPPQHTSHSNPEQQKWLHKLLGFNFNIKYKLGQYNMVADALSHCFVL